MATLKELLGDGYKDGMTFDEIKAALAGKNLVDLTTGDYVSKGKYQDALNDAAKHKAIADGEVARTKKAVEAAKEAYGAELEEKYRSEREADRRKRAKEKAYAGMNDEQRDLLDAVLKEGELTLDPDMDEFANWKDVFEPIAKKYHSVFPSDPTGTHGKAGLGSDSIQQPSGADEFAELRKIK